MTAKFPAFSTLCVALLLSITATAQEPGGSAAELAAQTAPQTLDELQAALAALIEEREVPAVGIAMVDANGPVWIGALGKANLENDIDADADSMFRIGSTSKMFVSLAVLKLVEEGRLSLNDKLIDLAPEIAYENDWEETDPIRVSHLLEHTTGWDDTHLPQYASNDPTPLTLKEGLDLHPHSRVSRWKPGTRMSYCNTGPPVAAYIVQKVTGQDFEDYVAKNFFAPLGMQTMTYRLSDDVRARGVTLYNNGNQPQDYWHIAIRPSGSINASPKDMAKMVALFINRGRVGDQALVSEASLARMETPKTTSAARAGQVYGYGLSNYSAPHKHWVYREHNGGVNGGITELAYLPEARLGHAIMINSGDGRTFRDISKLVRDFETRDLPVPDVTAVTPMSETQRGIAGLYYPINSRQQIAHFIERTFNIQKLWLEDGTLYRAGLLGGEPSAYLPAGDVLWQSDQTGVTALSQVNDPLAGPVVHSNMTVLKPASPAMIYGQLGTVALWAFMIATSLLWLPVWGIRRLRGKIPAGAPTRIRVYPLLAGLSAIAFVVVFNIAARNPFETLGAPTSYSVGIMLLTVAFALFAALGLGTSLTSRAGQMNRGTYVYSTLASLVHVIVAVYLGWFGIIGLMTWA